MGSPFKRDLTTARNLSQNAVRLQSGSFLSPNAYSEGKTNARERRISVSFPQANVPVVVVHNLGFTPSGFQELGNNAGTATAGGRIYNDFPLPATSQVIVLKCSVANTVADILVR